MNQFLNHNLASRLRNGTIEEIYFENATAFVTVSYTESDCCNDEVMRIVLVVGNNTNIQGMNGRRIPASALRVGMVINAVFSSAMTRSIPPQAAAFSIEVVQNFEADMTTTGRILEIDRQTRSFTLLSGGDTNSIIRFNVPPNARIVSRRGQQVPFSALMAGFRVRVRHANFMTLSLPPQTTAYEIQIL